MSLNLGALLAAAGISANLADTALESLVAAFGFSTIPTLLTTSLAQQGGFGVFTVPAIPAPSVGFMLVVAVLARVFSRSARGSAAWDRRSAWRR